MPYLELWCYASQMEHHFCQECLTGLTDADWRGTYFECPKCGSWLGLVPFPEPPLQTIRRPEIARQVLKRHLNRWFNYPI